MLKAKPESKSPPQKHGELAVPIRLRDRHRRSQQYHVLGLPFFTKVEDVNDDLVCNSAALRRVISQGAPVDGGLLDRLMEILGYRNPPTYAKAVYDNRTLYRMLNSLIVKCPCFWESRNGGADPARYGFGWMIDRIIRDRYKNYIESQMWMTGEVREAMGLKDPGTEGRSFYYFHPVNFMRDVAGGLLEEEAVPEFNPYLGYRFVRTDTGIPESKRAFIVEHNPGFAPLIGSQSSKFQGYAEPTHHFNVFAANATHSGVDFPVGWEKAAATSVDQAVPIHSLIHGMVVHTKNMGNSGFGNFIVIQSTNNQNHFFFLAHTREGSSIEKACLYTQV